MSAPGPLENEPRSVWPPFDVRDDRFDDLHVTEEWRQAVRLDRVEALLSPLTGLVLSEREFRALEWLAGWDVPTVAPLVRLLHAARAAATLPVEQDEPDDSASGDVETPGPDAERAAVRSRLGARLAAEQAADSAAARAGGVFVSGHDAGRLREDAERGGWQLAGRVLDVLGRGRGAR